MNFTILRFDELESTNSEALNQARRGADEGLCVVARRQTKGRGRHGRTWLSPKDAGLYFSIVLRPKIANKFFPLLTFAAAIAVYETLREFGIEPDIKWANDVHVGGKKISGILAETAETTKGLAIVVGIGINLTSENFPPEISAIATSVETESGGKADAEAALEILTRNFAEFYRMLCGENGAGEIRAAWTKRSSYANGKSVKAALENETITGTTCGIEDNGALRIKTADGDVKIIHAGDVETLRQVQK